MNRYLQPRKYLQFSKRVIAAFLRRTPVIRKHYRLQSRIDCITDACNLISENHRMMASRASSKTIEKRLSWLGINFGQLPAHYRGDLNTIFADQPLQLDRYDNLKQLISEAPVELLTCRQWLYLHEMCCFRGRYTLAQTFREKARLLAIQPLEGRAFKPPISWENTIDAAIEGGECRHSEDLDQLLTRAGITGDDGSKWRLYLAVLNGQDIPREWVQHFDGSDFADFLAGKTIAIVGPTPAEALDAEDIDRHDLVVRLNHSYEGKGTDPKYKGLRTDISCFNGEQGDSFLHERNGLLPEEVKWGVFKTPAAVSHVLEKNTDKHARLFSTLCQSHFHGNLNMMLIVALDLALFNANSLKIYHTDLMLSVMRQKGYYPESFNRSNDFAGMQQIFRTSSVVHDPVQQYRTLNSLWRNKKITGDARFVEVIEMGLSSYLTALELKYTDDYSSVTNSSISSS